MCHLKRGILSNYMYKSLKGLGSLMIHLPYFLLLFITFNTDYTPLPNNYIAASGEYYSSNDDVTCFRVNEVRLGDGNTNEGCRFETNSTESRVKSNESESSKLLAYKNSFTNCPKSFRYINSSKPACKDIACNFPVIFHQLLI